MENNQNQWPSKCPYLKFSNFLKKYTKPIPHFSDDTNVRKRETMELLNNATWSSKVSLEKGIFYHHYQKCFDDYYTFFCNNHKELLEEVGSKKYTYDDFNITNLQIYTNKIRKEIISFFMSEWKRRHNHIVNWNWDPQIKSRLEEFSNLKEFSDRKKMQLEEDELYKGYTHWIDTIVGIAISTIIDLKRHKQLKETINYNQLKKLFIQNSSEPSISGMIFWFLNQPTLLKTLLAKEIHANDWGYNDEFLNFCIDNYEILTEDKIDDDSSQ